MQGDKGRRGGRELLTLLLTLLYPMRNVCKVYSLCVCTTNMLHYLDGDTCEGWNLHCDQLPFLGDVALRVHACALTSPQGGN